PRRLPSLLSLYCLLLAASPPRILFFFYSYRPPRALHSFPTRRSSDLAARGRRDAGRAVARRKPGLRARRSGLAGARDVRRARAQDRKSTRLNSSHSQISYAVFCLKKKKKIELCETDRLRQAGHDGRW